MPQALEVVFPRPALQTCVVHLIGNSLDYSSWAGAICGSGPEAESSDPGSDEVTLA